MRHKKKKKININKFHIKNRFLNLFNSLIKYKIIKTTYKNISFYKNKLQKKVNTIYKNGKIFIFKLINRKGDNTMMSIIILTN
ncbi:hypothetical protein ACT2CR_00705 [Candidatus Vidania fulgoroideorum]